MERIIGERGEVLYINVTGLEKIIILLGTTNSSRITVESHKFSNNNILKKAISWLLQSNNLVLVKLFQKHMAQNGENSEN